MNKIIESLLTGNNYPPEGSVSFTSSDHIRFQNGQDVSGHNYGANRKLTIEKNIEGDEGYTVTMYNLDGMHPFWQNNVQMAPKQMKVVSHDNNIVELRGYGYDMTAVSMGAPLSEASFNNYGLSLLIEGGGITRAQLNLFDRNINIVYLQ